MLLFVFLPVLNTVDRRVISGRLDVLINFRVFGFGDRGRQGLFRLPLVAAASFLFRLSFLFHLALSFGKRVLILSDDDTPK